MIERISPWQIRLPNGRLMSLRAYQETMREKFPPSKEWERKVRRG